MDNVNARETHAANRRGRIKMKSDLNIRTRTQTRLVKTPKTECFGFILPLKEEEKEKDLDKLLFLKIISALNASVEHFLNLFFATIGGIINRNKSGD